MTLDAYLTTHGITAAMFGDLVGMSEASVSRIRAGKQNITRDVMLNIIKATNGEVTADGLISKVAA